MANRRPPSHSLVEDLRLTIDCMPVSTREAMLDGLRSSERIIVGAYVDGDSGVCPMLAAHRCGGRTNFLSFARSWDRFTRAGRRPSRAAGRELRILIGQLESSLMSETGVALDSAIAEHRALISRRARVDVVDPSGEIVVRRGRALSRRLHMGDKLARWTGRRSVSPVT